VALDATSDNRARNSDLVENIIAWYRVEFYRFVDYEIQLRSRKVKSCSTALARAQLYSHLHSYFSLMLAQAHLYVKLRLGSLGKVFPKEGSIRALLPGDVWNNARAAIWVRVCLS